VASTLFDLLGAVLDDLASGVLCDLSKDLHLSKSISVARPYMTPWKQSKIGSWNADPFALVSGRRKQKTHLCASGIFLSTSIEAAAPPIVNPMNDPIIPIPPAPKSLRPILIGGRRLLMATYVPRPHARVPTYISYQFLEFHLTSMVKTYSCGN
jgi:hypothetical protein